VPGNNQGHEFASQEIPPRSGGIHNAQTSRCRIGHRSWSSASRTNWCLRANLLQLRAHRYAISAKGCSICKSPYLRRRDPGMCVDCCSSARVARSRIHCSSTSYCCSSTPASHRGSPKLINGVGRAVGLSTASASDAAVTPEVSSDAPPPSFVPSASMVAPARS
jgi:hypothetical protein